MEAKTSKSKSRIVIERPKEAHISIHPSAFAKLKFWTEMAIGEVAGLGIVKEIKEEGRILSVEVYDVFLLKQATDSISCVLEPEDIQAFLSTLPEGTIEKVKFLWHSHVDMDVFWSSQDEACIDSLRNSYLFSLVLNKRGEVRARLDVFRPFPLCVDEIDVHIPIDSIPQKEISSALAIAGEKLLKSGNGIFIKEVLGELITLSAEKKEGMKAEFEAKVKEVTPSFYKNNMDISEQWIANYDFGGVEDTSFSTDIYLYGMSNESLIDILEQTIGTGLVSLCDKLSKRPTVISESQRRKFDDSLLEKCGAGRFYWELYTAESAWLECVDVISDQEQTEEHKREVDRWWESLWSRKIDNLPKLLKGDTLLCSEIVAELSVRGVIEAETCADLMQLISRFGIADEEKLASHSISHSIFAQGI